MFKTTLFRATAVFLCGALSYYALELLWRGYSHASMLLAGGTCFSFIYCAEKNTPHRYSLFVRCVLYAYAITAVELAFGLVCNRLLTWNVWDYSDKVLNLWGQICPQYFLLWIGVSFLATALAALLRRIWHIGGHKNATDTPESTE